MKQSGPCPFPFVALTLQALPKREFAGSGTGRSPGAEASWWGPQEPAAGGSSPLCHLGFPVAVPLPPSGRSPLCGVGLGGAAEGLHAVLSHTRKKAAPPLIFPVQLRPTDAGPWPGEVSRSRTRAGSPSPLHTRGPGRGRWELPLSGVVRPRPPFSEEGWDSPGG